jgi:hypothetical protein
MRPYEAGAACNQDPFSTLVYPRQNGLRKRS